jgi:hypothetical protein
MRAVASWLRWDGHHAFAASASWGLVQRVRRQAAQGSTAETKARQTWQRVGEAARGKIRLGVKLAGEKR